MHLSIHMSDDPDDFGRIGWQAFRLLGGELGEPAHGLDQSYWDLTLDGGVITIHREHYSGVIVFCENDPASIALFERYRSVVEAGDNTTHLEL
jgi:hypothetical protein